MYQIGRHRELNIDKTSLDVDPSGCLAPVADVYVGSRRCMCGQLHCLFVCLYSHVHVGKSAQYGLQ
jgi:hypothetical protein